jgi:inosose dehydratase
MANHHPPQRPKEFTRRAVLLTGVGSLIGAGHGPSSPLSVEGYIWQQYAARQKKKLGGVLDEIFPMARKAGYRNVELNQEYFAPELQDRVANLVRDNSLAMPSVYVGGVMHEPGAAEQTIARAVEIGGLCKPFGCRGVVHNPTPKPAGAEKTDDELRIQAESLNKMGRALAGKGLQLRVHHHTPEMVAGAREWRQILHNTDPKYVSLCMDLDWVHQGGQDPLGLLKEAGRRVTEIHIRNSKDKLWLESLEAGDIDYRPIAEYLKASKLSPLLVVELAYRENTVVTRPLEEDLRLSRIYAEKIFFQKG